VLRGFLNARSPLRILERGLHGGLGRGNLGLVLAGHGVGKTPFLVGVALDGLLRGDQVLHVALDSSVAHTRAHYDTLFDDLAQATRLEDEAVVRGEALRLLSIRAWPRARFGVEKLREALRVAEETGARPGLLIVEGFEVAAASGAELDGLAALARELPAELWLSAALPGEQAALPEGIAPGRFAVILALEPGHSAVALRALKDHDSPGAGKLRVSLDPRTLLLKRS